MSDLYPEDDSIFALRRRLQREQQTRQKQRQHHEAERGAAKSPHPRMGGSLKIQLPHSPRRLRGPVLPNGQGIPSDAGVSSIGDHGTIIPLVRARKDHLIADCPPLEP